MFRMFVRLTMVLFGPAKNLKIIFLVCNVITKYKIAEVLKHSFH